jgi:hypothetical protein
MSSPSTDTAVEPRAHRETLSRVLDLAFGFFVWAVHFLVVYVAAATYCVVNPDAAESGASGIFSTALAIVTVAAVLTVLVHAWLRYRRRTGLPDERFRLAVIVGCDAIAALAIGLQLVPLRLVPWCA